MADLGTVVTIRCTLGEWAEEYADQFRRKWVTGLRGGGLETAALVFLERAGWRWRAWYPTSPLHEEGIALSADEAKRRADEAVGRLVAAFGVEP